MKNPYVILNIKSDATNEEIELARKKQLMLQCGVDNNIKNEEGEYLQQVINEAANDLLDPQKRKVIDEKLPNKSPIIYNSTYLSLASIHLTKINQGLIEEVQKVKLEKKFFDKRASVRKLFLFVLENHYIGYAEEEKYPDGYGLCEYFSKRFLTNDYVVGNCPWDYLQIFQVDGLLTIAYPAYQILPISVIQNEMVTDTILRQIYPILQRVVSKNIEELDLLFQQEHEKEKVKKKE